LVSTAAKRKTNLFPFGGEPYNGGKTPKWMVYMENPIKWMIWGYHHLRKHPFHEILGFCQFILLMEEILPPVDMVNIQFFIGFHR